MRHGPNSLSTAPAWECFQYSKGLDACQYSGPIFQKKQLQHQMPQKYLKIISVIIEAHESID